MQEAYYPLPARLRRPQTLTTPRSTHECGTTLKVKIFRPQAEHLTRPHPALSPYLEKRGRVRIKRSGRLEDGAEFGGRERVYVIASRPARPLHVEHWVGGQKRFVAAHAVLKNKAQHRKDDPER